MKIIDLLNKIAKGEEVPKKIKYCNKIYIKRSDCYWYTLENGTFDDDLFIKINCLNDEVEILEEVEDKEYEDIEEFKEYKLINTRDILELEMIINKINADYNYKINALIRNQKYILERLNK